MDFRKTIKVLSILALIGGILSVLGGAFMLLGGGAATAISQNQELMSEMDNDEEMAAKLAQMNAQAGTDLDASKTMLGTGIIIFAAGAIVLILGILEIIQGSAGLKAAKGYGAGKAFGVGIAVLVLNIISAVLNISRGAGIWSSAISIAITALYVYCAKMIKDEEEPTF